MIAEMTGADTFEIKTVQTYPADYKETTEVAKRELAENARPALAAQVPIMADYDVVFLGYPIWWSDLPMPVYTFLESYDWNGKTIVPFVTSAGDVLTGKERDIPNYAKGAKMLDGIGFEGKRVQENPDSVRPEVEKWLTGTGLCPSEMNGDQMKRPYIFCHMMTSLDGKIMGTYMDTPEGTAAGEMFYYAAGLLCRMAEGMGGIQYGKRRL